MNESMLKEHKKVNNSTCYLATRDLFQKPVFVCVDIALKCEQAFILKKKKLELEFNAHSSRGWSEVCSICKLCFICFRFFFFSAAVFCADF